jgi:Na+-transporting NADH:ubiquinone oxidoreductase subunit NqrB
VELIMGLAIDNKPAMTFVAPRPKDPRVTIAAALTLWTVLGQTTYYFTNDPVKLAAAIVPAIILDFCLALVFRRQIMIPLSAYITGLSIGILLAGHDWYVFAVAGVWGILSKHLLRDGKRHFFNPSNFGIVMALLLSHGQAIVAPGSQWGADYRVAFVIIALGLLMMKRVNRLDLALAWASGYVFMGLLRMAAGQGGLVFVLGPMTGAEFALFSFSMMPDPKASPPTRRGRIAWGLSIAVTDGILRYLEVRYSMFYTLFAHTAILPVMYWLASRRGLAEADPWRSLRVSLRRDSVSASPGYRLSEGPQAVRTG